MLPDIGCLDFSSIERYLTFLSCPGTGTPLKHVSKLAPGEAMIVRHGNVEQRWLWKRLPVFSYPNSASVRKKTAIEGTLTLLRQAVQRQLLADVPVGAFLSGGLDSSAIVALAREHNEEIRCFTIETLGEQDAGITNDLPYAERVAKHLNVALDVVSVDSGRIVADLENMVMHLDEPVADLAGLNVLYISQLARSQGIKVLLSGTGGDDVFSGYRRHRALVSEWWWSWLPMSVRVGIAEVGGLLDQRKAFGRRAAKLLGAITLSGDERLVNYFRWVSRADLERLYSREFRLAVSSSMADKPMLDFLSEVPSNISKLERMLSLDQRFFLADHNLLYTDKMSMAAGVEVRVPFLDPDLIDFASRIPDRFKQRGKDGKWVLKKAMEAYLPHDVIYRPKTGFGVPLRRWIRNELRELLGDLLSTESLKRRGLFNPEAVHELITANENGRVDASYTLLSLLCIEIWCRRFIDQQAF
jgi:asparagine synthase (glutamine-hydrolysing)